MSKGPAPFDQGLFLMHLHKGKEYFDHDQLEKAREELEAAYHLRPQDEKILNMLGMTYYKLEMLPEAEDMYVTLAANNPDIYALQSNLGLIQLKLNRLQQARDSLNRALELQPTNSKAHFYMGLLYEKQGLWEDALYHFEQANAEKMVAKMQIKLDEQLVKSESVIPFEVVEVMEPEEIPAAEQDFASLIQEEVQSQADENTGKIKVPDLAEAMLQMHEEEVPAPEAGVETQIHEPVEETQNTENLHPVFEQSDAEDQTPQEEELVQEESPGQMPEQMEEEIQEERPWEKTHPTLFPEQLESEPEAIIHTETSVLINPTIDDPFLLSDDIAADISTFLAQSRSQENPEEDVFYQEPVLTELTIVSTSEPMEEEIPVEQEAEPYRIPTPEEVENEISAAPSDESVAETPVDNQAKLIAEVVERLMSQPPEETVEELSDALLSNSVVSSDLETHEEEELEVNFAVTESEEEESEIQQGFLQPSPLTPEIEEEEEEEKLEQTQDMAYTVEPSAAESNLLDAEISPAESQEEPNPEESVVAVQADEVQEEMVVQEAPDAVQEPAMPEPIPEPVSEEESAPELIPEPAPQPREKLGTQEMTYPANLDQFSRDRLYIQPFIGSDRFLLIDPHLLEIIISEKLICRIGTISSYTGNLQFTPWDEDQKKQFPLVVVTGSGIIFLADRRKEVLLISLNNEVIFVEANHFLVAQSSLRVDPQVFRQEGTENSFSIVRISGRGTFALTCQTKPLTVNVREELPANIPAQAIIAWSGKLHSEVLDDKDLKKILMSSEADHMFLRFRGSGDVVVEQGGLWGDRKTTRNKFHRSK